eukprot:3756763-Amphidinium_carterae.1
MSIVVGASVAKYAMERSAWRRVAYSDEETINAKFYAGQDEDGVAWPIGSTTPQSSHAVLMPQLESCVFRHGLRALTCALACP